MKESYRMILDFCMDDIMSEEKVNELVEIFRYELGKYISSPRMIEEKASDFKQRERLKDSLDNVLNHGTAVIQLLVDVRDNYRKPTSKLFSLIEKHQKKFDHYRFLLRSETSALHKEGRWKVSK